MKRLSLKELIEDAFWIDSSGSVMYCGREDTPLPEPTATKVRNFIRKHKLKVSDYQKK